MQPSFSLNSRYSVEQVFDLFTQSRDPEAATMKKVEPPSSEDPEMCVKERKTYGSHMPGTAAKRSPSLRIRLTSERSGPDFPDQCGNHCTHAFFLCQVGRLPYQDENVSTSTANLSASSVCELSRLVPEWSFPTQPLHLLLTTSTSPS